MNSIMDKLGNARRWAACVMANDGPIDARDEVLVDVIRAVEMLAMERQDKPASDDMIERCTLAILNRTSGGAEFAPDHRKEVARLDAAAVLAEVSAELAARDKRIAELEKRLAEATAPLTVDGIGGCRILRWPECVPR